jgi:hypothetical protein
MMEKKPVSLEELLEESIELTRENNRLLKAMRRDALIAGIVKVLIWGALIGGSIYFSLKYLEPLLVPAQELGENKEALQMLLDVYNGKFPDSMP